MVEQRPCGQTGLTTYSRVAWALGFGTVQWDSCAALKYTMVAVITLQSNPLEYKNSTVLILVFNGQGDNNFQFLQTSIWFPFSPPAGGHPAALPQLPLWDQKYQLPFSG